MRTALLIIDPQVDFCDPQKGALYVEGADQDMQRLAEMVHRQTARLDAVYVTLDTHFTVDIAHPIFWQDAGGNHPEPFTLIHVADVESGRWRTTKPEMQARSLEYVRALERGKRYQLCIWPYHCLQGSEGHAVQPELFAALQQWERQFAIVNYVLKGSNIFTEHYSAIQAEVPDPDDPSTQINTALIESLRQAERVLIAGEAGSHCVANTVRDLADHLGRDTISRLTLLTDATGPVTGFELLQETFIRDMQARGMQLATTKDAF